MTPEQIAETILGTLMPEARKSWRYEVGSATTLIQITFRPRSLAMGLDISALLGCFQDVRNVSWQEDVADDYDSPRIVIEGGVRGKSIQASFVLKVATN